MDNFRDIIGEHRTRSISLALFKTWIILGVCILVALIIILNSFSVVDATERGVLIQMGEIKGDVLQPGIKFKIPFIQKVRKYSITPYSANINIDVGNNSIISKDNQDIGASMDIFWSFDENQIVTVASSYTRSSLESIVLSTARNALKTVVGRYNVYDLAEAQDEINTQIKEFMSGSLQEYPVRLTDVKLINFDWSPAFTAQIEETMKVTQQIKIAEQEKQIKQVQSESQVIEAEAQKKAALLKAEAEYETAVRKAEAEKETARLQAEAKVLEGNAIKEYNAALKENIETEIRLRELENEKTRIEKWDGKYVPNNMYGPIPVDTIGGIQGQ